MATIYWDDGTARAAGAAVSPGQGNTIVFRTDTRWHVGAPASMTGCIGQISTSVGSEIKFDGTKVRWMAYDTGSGNVPAIGTTITQGGVSGYLLGVWASLAVAPTAVGAAMPATGYIKFREVTGGQFSIGALTGIGANATEPDRVGWIEIVGVSSSSHVLSYNSTINSIGDWFELGVTTGAPGQIIQIPSNGGGASTFVHGIQIETSVGSNVYEWYHVHQSAQFTAANLGTTARAKFVRQAGSGQVMIGSTGSVNAGYTPVAGLRIRTPNIFFRVCSNSASGATNIAPTASTFPINTSSINLRPKYNFSNASIDWALAGYYCDEFVIKDSVFFSSSLNLTNVFSYFKFDGVCISPTINGGTTVPAMGAPNPIITNSKISTYSGSFSVTGLTDVIISNTEFSSPIGTGTASNFNITNCSKVTVSNIKTKGYGFVITSSNNLVIQGHDYCSTVSGDTTSTNTGGEVLTISGNSNNISYSNLTFGENGTFPISNPYNSIFMFTGCSDVKIRNIGTLSSPVFAYNATLSPASIAKFNSGNNKNIEFKRCFFGHARTAVIESTSITNNIKFINFGFPITSATTSFSSVVLNNDSSIQGFVTGAAAPTSAPSIGYGTNTKTTTDIFGSSTTGAVTLNFGPAVTLVATQNSYKNINSIQFAANSAATDYAIIESEYFIKGHNSISNISVVSNSVPNMNVVYQIDKGAGWNGTWKTGNAATLQSEVINPDIGFKIKFKVNNTSASSSYYISSITLTTVIPNRSSQPNYFYTLDTASLSFTGLIPGSEVRVYVGTDPATSVEIGGTEATGGSTFSISQSVGGQEGYIVILAMGYQPIYLPYTFKSVDDSILIQPVVDRNYNNPV